MRIKSKSRILIRLGRLARGVYNLGVSIYTFAVLQEMRFYDDRTPPVPEGRRLLKSKAPSRALSCSDEGA